MGISFSFSYNRTVFGCIPMIAATSAVLYVFTVSRLHSLPIYHSQKVWCYSVGFYFTIEKIFSNIELLPGFLLIFLLLLGKRNVQQIIHIGLDIMKLLHIRPGLLIGGIGFPFLFQQAGVFLPK